MKGSIPGLPGLEVTEDPLTGALTGERIGQRITEDELLEAAGLSRETHVVVKSVPNCWHTAMKLEYRDEDGKLEKTEPCQVLNWSLRLDVRPLHDEILAREIRDELLEEIRKEVKAEGRRKKLKVKRNQSSVMVEIDVFDAHFQKLAWGPETGTNYDLKIAAEEYRAATQALIAEARDLGVPIEKWVLCVGQDLFHTDNEEYRTAAGTRQDVDGRTKKAFRIVRVLLTEIILDLLEDAPVDVVVVPGNHGPERDWVMGEIIDARFETNPNVRVDNRPINQKYIRFGNSLIGYAHGKDEKLKDLKDFMTHDCPKDFAECIYREWHLGHLHHEWDVKDAGGVVVRYLPSISGTDAWHRNSGYIGAQRGARAFVWTKDRGCNKILIYSRPRTAEEMSYTEPMVV